ncbi:hypothetical protein Sste5346_009553 [Sporothrix stenoceras]|uniref:Uncharacterized protein n=1 Tax=Sporothrix stenoceras TaxID=5173 RepID=A0ABR3YJK7_9PEZI
MPIRNGNSLIDIYFARLHPWIPMLHVHQFRQKIADPAQRPRLVSIRFSNDERLGDDSSRAELATKCRETVILHSMKSFLVENIQALIICAFDTSIIGSMTRTVEQLQLSVEDEDQPQSTANAKALIRRIAFFIHLVQLLNRHGPDFGLGRR